MDSLCTAETNTMFQATILQRKLSNNRRCQNFKCCRIVTETLSDIFNHFNTHRIILHSNQFVKCLNLFLFLLRDK